MYRQKQGTAEAKASLLEGKIMEAIIKQLEDAGYDYAVAIATKAEIEAGAACGQLSLILANQ